MKTSKMLLAVLTIIVLLASVVGSSSPEIVTVAIQTSVSQLDSLRQSYHTDVLVTLAAVSGSHLPDVVATSICSTLPFWPHFSVYPRQCFSGNCMHSELPARTDTPLLPEGLGVGHGQSTTRDDLETYVFSTITMTTVEVTSTTVEPDTAASTDITFSEILGKAGLAGPEIISYGISSNSAPVAAPTASAIPSAVATPGASTPGGPESLNLAASPSAAAPTGTDPVPFSGLLNTFLSSVAYSEVTAEGYTTWVTPAEAIASTSAPVIVASSFSIIEHSAAPYSTPVAPASSWTSSPATAAASSSSSAESWTSLSTSTASVTTTSTPSSSFSPAPIPSPTPIPLLHPSLFLQKVKLGLTITLPIVALILICFPILYWLKRRATIRKLNEDLERNAVWLTPNRTPTITPNGSGPLTPAASFAVPLTPPSCARTVIRVGGGGSSTPHLGSSESPRGLGIGSWSSQIGLALTTSISNSTTPSKSKPKPKVNLRPKAPAPADDDPFDDTGITTKEAWAELERLRNFAARQSSPLPTHMIDMQPVLELGSMNMGVSEENPERTGSMDPLIRNQGYGGGGEEQGYRTHIQLPVVGGAGKSVNGNERNLNLKTGGPLKWMIKGKKGLKRLK